MQVFHSRLGSRGEESLTDHQSELGHFGGHQSHNEQDEQDDSQRNYGVIEQQLGFRKTPLLKQGHSVGKVFLMVLLSKWYTY